MRQGARIYPVFHFTPDGGSLNDWAEDATTNIQVILPWLEEYGEKASWGAVFGGPDPWWIREDTSAGVTVVRIKPAYREREVLCRIPRSLHRMLETEAMAVLNGRDHAVDCIDYVVFYTRPESVMLNPLRACHGVSIFRAPVDAYIS